MVNWVRHGIRSICFVNCNSVGAIVIVRRAPRSYTTPSLALSPPLAVHIASNNRVNGVNIDYIGFLSSSSRLVVV